MEERFWRFGWKITVKGKIKEKGCIFVWSILRSEDEYTD